MNQKPFDLEHLLWDFHRPHVLRMYQGQLFSDSGHQAGAPVFLPSSPISQMGNPHFCRQLGVELPYVAGAMANGIASQEMVVALAQHGLLGFYGAAGQAPRQVAAAIEGIQASCHQHTYGFNLIHSPAEPATEMAVAQLYCQKGVTLVEASAYLDLALPVLRYRLAGIRKNADGSIHAPNRVIAKVSRVEVAEKFLRPAPEALLDQLQREGFLTAEQRQWAAQIPVAQYLTAESDSGGHTDNRPLITLLPAMLSLRDRLQKELRYPDKLMIGAGGGISTPHAAAAVFAMGADYVVTGSVNQSCVESGTSDAVKSLLAQAQQADTMMAPAADMFEMGVKVQVLKRGTMFPMRAGRLYELYRSYSSIDAIPAEEQKRLQDQVFRKSFSQVWKETEDYFAERDPSQTQRAAKDPKHKMALIFRSYLGQSSLWANAGVKERAMDYQIWCGPAMGAFNEWVKGSFLASPQERRVVSVAYNLMLGALVCQRMQILKLQGCEIPDGLLRPRPITREALSDGIGHSRVGTPGWEAAIT